MRDEAEKALHAIELTARSEALTNVVRHAVQPRGAAAVIRWEDGGTP